MCKEESEGEDWERERVFGGQKLDEAAEKRGVLGFLRKRERERELDLASHLRKALFIYFAFLQTASNKIKETRAWALDSGYGF